MTWRRPVLPGRLLGHHLQEDVDSSDRTESESLGIQKPRDAVSWLSVLHCRCGRVKSQPSEQRRHSCPYVVVDFKG